MKTIIVRYADGMIIGEAPFDMTTAQVTAEREIVEYRPAWSQIKTPFGSCWSTRVLASLTHYTFLNNRFMAFC